MPELMPENEEALFFWLEIRTQWRTSIGGPVGLDYPAIRLEAQALDVDLSAAMMAKIKALEQHEITRQQRGNESRHNRACPTPAEP